MKTRIGDGIKSHPRGKHTGGIPVPTDRAFILSPGADLRDPPDFPHAAPEWHPSRYSVPAGPSRGAQHFLLLVSNMGLVP